MSGTEAIQNMKKGHCVRMTHWPHNCFINAAFIPETFQWIILVHGNSDFLRDYERGSDGQFAMPADFLHDNGWEVLGL